MRIVRVDIQNIRCIVRSSLEPSPGLNLLIGGNGSGKTSLLEGMFYLGHGRSFRRVEFDKLVRRGQDSLSVFGEVAEGEHRSRLGIEKRRGSGRIRVDGADASSNRVLAERLVVGAYFPGREALIWGPSRDRRRLLDWLLFHVEPDYGIVLRRFADGLRQRNILLREGKNPRSIRSWSEALATEGERLHDLRARLMTEFAPRLADDLSRTLDRAVEVRYRRGWRAGEELSVVWHSGLSADLRRGWTGSGGPHQADILLTMEGVPCRDMLSRGQGKLASLELFLAAVALVRARSGRRAVILLDDLRSEVDNRNLDALLSTLGSIGHQVFITFVDLPSHLARGMNVPDAHMFHVEQGEVSEVL